MTRWMSITTGAALALMGLAAGGQPAAAQTDSRLAAVVRLAQDGLADSARAELQRVLGGLTPTDSLYPQALYTQALVAVTDGERRLALRKVIVEYSTSAWADDAILLLGQLEYANGNPGGTVTQITKLLNDYPLSPLRATAAFWGARAASDVGNGSLACKWVDIGLGAPTDDVELKNRLDYQKQRCEGLVTIAADSAKNAPAPSPTPAPPPAPAPAPAPSPAPTPPPNRPGPTKATPGYYVQIMAAPSREAAQEQENKLKRLNYASVIVEEGGYFKVRAGPFTNRSDAQSALNRIARELGSKPFVVSVK
jgi:SPOR domain